AACARGGAGAAGRGRAARGTGGSSLGPDTGLLAPAADRAGIESAHELANPAYALEPVSRTFHGRDVFAPAAAHLALGVDPAELGPAFDPAELIRFDVPEPEIGQSRIRATVLYVDRFGNVQLNLSGAEAASAQIEPGTRI